MPMRVHSQQKHSSAYSCDKLVLARVKTCCHTKGQVEFLHHLRTTCRKSTFNFRGPRIKPHTRLYNVEAKRARFNFCRAPAGLNIVKRSVQVTFPEKLKLLSRRAIARIAKTQTADNQSPRLFRRSLREPSADIRFPSGLSSRR